jgi:hypothetical protein
LTCALRVRPPMAARVTNLVWMHRDIATLLG